MNDHGKSDGPVLPAKPPNKPGLPGAEVVEGRGPAEGNTASETRPDAVPDRACQVIWIVCAMWRGRTGMCGSLRSFIT